MATRDETFTIVQISDLHCGTQFFLPNLLERAITEVNDLHPEILSLRYCVVFHRTAVRCRSR